MNDPRPRFYNVLAHNELDRPLYETVVTLTGFESEAGFREAMAFGQRQLSETGFVGSVKRWVVTVYTPNDAT